MNTILHGTARKRAKTARAGAFAQLAGGGGAQLFADAPVARFLPHSAQLGQRAARPLHDISRKDFGLLTSDFANRPLSEVRCPLSHLKLTAPMGNYKKETQQ